MTGLQRLNRALLGTLMKPETANIIADRLEELEAEMGKLRTENICLRQDLEGARNDADRYRDAIKWALGESETDGFRPRVAGDPPYWWRPELRERARLDEENTAGQTRPAEPLKP